MYVRDLKPGLLIRPVEDYGWDIRTIETEDFKGTAWHGLGKGNKELINSGILHHATPCFRRGSSDRQIAIYLGVKQLKDYYYGVKRQHMVLIGSVLTVIDGYQFGEIEKV